MRSWGALGVLLGSLGALLGHSWGALGRSWGALGALLGPSWAFLGRSWGALGTLWVLLGALGALWGCLGALLGRFWMDFSWIFARFGVALIDFLNPLARFSPDVWFAISWYLSLLVGCFA